MAWPARRSTISWSGDSATSPSAAFLAPTTRTIGPSAFLVWSRNQALSVTSIARQGHRAWPAPRPREQRGWTTEAEVAQWIEQLPKPVGVMACNDIRAQQVLMACRVIGVGVPDEVAVLGVDNDELLCDLSDPPLSSVVPDTHRIGFEAASLLDQMMRGEHTPEALTSIPPIGVLTRLSTDVLAIDDRTFLRQSTSSANTPATGSRSKTCSPNSPYLEASLNDALPRSSAAHPRPRSSGCNWIGLSNSWPRRMFLSNRSRSRPAFGIPNT